MRRVAELGHRVHEWTSAEGIGGKPALQPVEITQYLLEQRPFGGSGFDQVAREIGEDQLVLRRKIIVERALADADFSRDRVDPDGADALAVEQAAGRIENPRLHDLFG